MEQFSTDKVFQEVLSDNTEIFERICAELRKAESQILIASAWFTDPDIFEILEEKATVIDVDLVVGDNEDNNKLDFGLLISKGAKCLKVKNAGFGMMHQKFCVIDRKLAIHGSYNYTLNARRNNHESVIVTTHVPTVNSLIETFYELKTGVSRISPVTEQNGSADKPSPITTAQRKPDYQIEFEKVLHSLIDAELNVFDRKEVSQQGFRRSENCNGDYNILPNALDSVYFQFTTDNIITADRKEKLLVKVAEHKTSEVQLLDLEHTNTLNRISVEYEVKKTTLKNLIEEKQTEIAQLEKRISSISENKIPERERIISHLRERINNAKIEFIKPKIKWYDFLTTVIGAIILLAYLVIFYSSAAYILIFSKEDTIKAIKLGAEIPPHQVFQPKAIQLALDHGGSSILFIFLFVAIPIFFALADRYAPSKFWKVFISYVLGILLIDSMLAYKVSQSIHEIRALAGETNVPWSFDLAISDTNFYLVFVMGAAALLVFKFLFGKMMETFEQRDPDLHAQRNKLLIKQLEEEVEEEKRKIAALKEEIKSFEETILFIKRDKTIAQTNIDMLPVEQSLAESKENTEYTLKQDYFNHICDIFKNKIANNNPTISLDALRDRINTFLEGWNDYLHKFYSVAIASEKSKQASLIAAQWFNEKFHNGEVVLS